MVPRSPIAFPPPQLVPFSILPHNDFLNCHVLLLLHTLYYPLLFISGTVCVRSSWLLRQIQLFLHRSHVAINSYRITNLIFIIVASIILPLVHSLIGVYLCLFTHDTSTSMMTINDDTYNRQIRRIVTS